MYICFVFHLEVSWNTYILKSYHPDFILYYMPCELLSILISKTLCQKTTKCLYQGNCLYLYYFYTCDLVSVSYNLIIPDMLLLRNKLKNLFSFTRIGWWTRLDGSKLLGGCITLYTCNE